MALVQRRAAGLTDQHQREVQIEPGCEQPGRDGLAQRGNVLAAGPPG